MSRRVVIVSAPGATSAPHWSQPLAGDLAAALAAAGAQVRWFAAVAADQPGVPGADLLVVKHRPLHRVAAGATHVELEVELVRELRASAADAVVHVGIGARGSVNVPWLADRLGSRAFAIARAAEVVCQRGDLIDEQGLPCARHEEPDRCRQCCAASWWRAPRADDFRSRLDLLVASLQVCSSVFVGSAAEATLLEATGVPRRALAVMAPFGASALAAHVLAPAAAGREA